MQVYKKLFVYKTYFMFEAENGVVIVDNGIFQKEIKENIQNTEQERNMATQFQFTEDGVVINDGTPTLEKIVDVSEMKL